LGKRNVALSNEVEKLKLAQNEKQMMDYPHNTTNPMDSLVSHPVMEVDILNKFIKQETH
jgi:hypothetical protein